MTFPGYGGKDYCIVSFVSAAIVCICIVAYAVWYHSYGWKHRPTQKLGQCKQLSSSRRVLLEQNAEHFERLNLRVDFDHVKSFLVYVWHVHTDGQNKQAGVNSHAVPVQLCRAFLAPNQPISQTNQRI